MNRPENPGGAGVRQAPVREFRATPVRTEPGYRQAGAQGGNRTHDLRLTKALLYL